MALEPLQLRKFQFTTEEDATTASIKLNKIKYVATSLGSATLCICRPTKKLQKVLTKFDYIEAIPSDFDREYMDKKTQN